MFKKIRNLFSGYPFFLLLLPLFIVVHMELQFGMLYTFSLVYKQILFLFFCPVVLFSIFYAFIKDIRKSGFLAFTICFFIFYGSDFKYFLMTSHPSFFLSKYKFLLPVSLLLLSVICIAIGRSRSSFTKGILYMNCIFSLFILYDGYRILITKYFVKPAAAPEYILKKPCDSCSLPDIYYLVFDGYSSGKFLQSEFGFNNAATDSFLEKNNFKILRDAKSNYNITPYSVSSTFNMAYNADIQNGVFLLQDYVAGVKEMYHNRLFPALVANGYAVHNLSFFDIKGVKRTAPRFDVFSMQHLFDRYNLFYQVYSDLDFHFADWLFNSKKEEELFYNLKDRYNTGLFDFFKKEMKTRSEQPAFFYIHYYTPHVPYTRDANGNRLEFEKREQQPEAAQYLAQIGFTNKLMAENVDFILEQNPKKKIVILQADHGFRFEKPEKYKDEFPNFSAIYFSDTALLPKIPVDLNNVNTFRYVFNLFFGTNLAYLPAEQFALKYRTRNFN
jgi:hypothetical protein